MRRITKKEFYDLGGFANSSLFRKAKKSGVWTYWQDTSYNQFTKIKVI